MIRSCSKPAEPLPHAIRPVTADWAQTGTLQRPPAVFSRPVLGRGHNRKQISQSLAVNCIYFIEDRNSLLSAGSIQKLQNVSSGSNGEGSLSHQWLVLRKTIRNYEFDIWTGPLFSGPVHIFLGTCENRPAGGNGYTEILMVQKITFPLATTRPAWSQSLQITENNFSARQSGRANSPGFGKIAMSQSDNFCRNGQLAGFNIVCWANRISIIDSAKTGAVVSFNTSCQGNYFRCCVLSSTLGQLIRGAKKMYFSFCVVFLVLVSCDLLSPARL